MVCYKIHNFIIDCNGNNRFDSSETQESNNVQGIAVVHVQKNLHTENELVANRRLYIENSEMRYYSCYNLHACIMIRS